MLPTVSRFVLAGGIMVGFTAVHAQDVHDWPAWRGPDGTGVSTTAKPPCRSDFSPARPVASHPRPTPLSGPVRSPQLGCFFRTNFRSSAYGPLTPRPSASIDSPPPVNTT